GACEVSTGVIALQKQLQKIDLLQALEETRQEIKNSYNATRREKLEKRFEAIETLHISEQSPSQLVLEVLPVMPLLYRSMEPEEEEAKPLDSLYQSVFTRNLRCKRLVDLNAPKIVLRSEKIQLQDAV